MNALSGLFVIVIGIVIVAGIFAMIREILLWYFRINEAIQVAKETRDYLKALVEMAEGQPQRLTTPQR